jgi:mannose-6-phosphate isomerase-like protein (cupin superfamily)
LFQATGRCDNFFVTVGRVNIEFKKSYNTNVPTWDSCLSNFNQSVIDNDIIKHKCFGFFVSHQAHLISEVQHVLSDLQLRVAHLYMNITVHGGSFGRHQDSDNVFFWQAQGQTIWSFDDNTEYLLEPGDLIIVPKHTYHNVTPLGPRVGISMSL